MLVAGCDQVFGLQQPAPDGPAPDAVDMLQDSDGDTVPDFRDNCAAVVNVDQMDGDGDDVGDACDPRPGVHDGLVHLEMFRGEKSRWKTMPDVGWVRQDGAIVSPPGGQLAFDSTLDLDRPVLQIRFAYLDFGMRDDHNNQIALELESDDTSNCQAREDDASDAKSNLLMHMHEVTQPLIKDLTPELAPVTGYTFTYARGTTSSCTLGTYATATVADAPTDRLITKPKIGVILAIVKIEWIAIYQVVP